MKTRRQAHIRPVLKSLHWLPVRFKIDFKVLLAFKCLCGLCSFYFCDLLLPHEPSRTLRHWPVLPPTCQNKILSLGGVARGVTSPSREGS